MPFHDWEKTPNFDPPKVSVNCQRWVNYQRSLLTEAQEMADNTHITHRAPVAQLVEHRAVTREVVSSTPAGPTLRVFK